MENEQLYGLVRDVPDFPEPGVVFKDITPLIRRPDAFQRAIETMSEAFHASAVEKVLAIESRGFIFGAPVSQHLGAGLIMARKPGKLPWKTHRVDYDLEYGSDTIEIHQDAIDKGERVLVVDDVLATGGTAAAACQVVEQAGGQVIGTSFLIELAFLAGRQRLNGTPCHAVLTYP